MVLHAPGTSPLGGGVRGRENVFARVRQMSDLSGETFETVSTALSANGDFVSLLHDVTAKRATSGSITRWPSSGGATT